MHTCGYDIGPLRLGRCLLGYLMLMLMLMLMAMACQAQDWPLHGGNSHEQRYSPLAKINTHNVDALGLSWFFDTDFNRGLEATPIVVDGVMYVTGNWSLVYALDARTGELLWRYDPQVPREWAKMACCDVVNRGVAVQGSTVVFGTLDARLIALDANSGQELWQVQTADIQRWPYTITGAPRIAKGKVFIGNGGAEFGVRGFVSAYDLKTGELIWRFYTVPGNPADGFENATMQQAAQTWSGDWWRYGGGGTVWDSIVYDSELDQLYIGVGNGSPWNRDIRSPGGGDNLFLSSIVALDPDSGDYLWHYQETPADNWDYTATQHIMLATMDWQGQSRPVIWHAPKNGFFFIIDRRTGELLSAEAYVPVNWAEGYDMATGRPIETARASYQQRARFIRPSSLGAHNWQPMAHSPKTGLVYIPAMDGQLEYRASERDDYQWGHWNTGVNQKQLSLRNPALDQRVAAGLFDGYLLAWDPKTQQERWRLPHRLGWNGGILASAGDLVFQGTADGQLLAVNANTGERLWSFDAQVGIMAPPVSYEIDGEQYISVMAGWGGAYGLIGGIARHYPVPPSRVLTFKLQGQQQLPAKTPGLAADWPLPVRPTEDGDIIDRGDELYHEYCFMCHGMGLAANQAIPDLRRLPMPFYDNFNAIVIDGIMAKTGMVGFKDVLSVDDSQAIYAYVIDAAHQLRGESQPSWFNKMKHRLFDRISWVASWVVGWL